MSPIIWLVSQYDLWKGFRYTVACCSLLGYGVISGTRSHFVCMVSTAFIMLRNAAIMVVDEIGDSAVTLYPQRINMYMGQAYALETL